MVFNAKNFFMLFTLCFILRNNLVTLFEDGIRILPVFESVSSHINKKAETLEKV